MSVKEADAIAQLKIELDQLNHNVKDIKDVLLGTEFNQNKGIIHFFEDFEKRLKIVEKKHEEEEIYKKQRLWLITIFGTSVGGFLIYLAKKMGL
jgi:hypothetical protein